MHYLAKLTSVEGDEEDFADLIGRKGTLMRLAEGPSFQAEGADPLTMPARRVADDGETVVVHSKLGNKFTFKILPKS